MSALVEEGRLDCLIRSARLSLKSSPSCIFVSGSTTFSSSGQKSGAATDKDAGGKGGRNAEVAGTLVCSVVVEEGLGSSDSAENILMFRGSSLRRKPLISQSY